MCAICVRTGGDQDGGAAAGRGARRPGRLRGALRQQPAGGLRPAPLRPRHRHAGRARPARLPAGRPRPRAAARGRRARARPLRPGARGPRRVRRTAPAAPAHARFHALQHWVIYLGVYVYNTTLYRFDTH